MGSAPDSEEATIDACHRIVDLLAGVGRGPLWGVATNDLNLTLLSWRPGEGTAEHVNRELDVALVIVAGSGTIVLDGEAHDARAGQAVVVPKGATRQLTAGPQGIRYVSVHRRRGGLQIGRITDEAAVTQPAPSTHPRPEKGN